LARFQGLWRIVMNRTIWMSLFLCSPLYCLTALADGPSRLACTVSYEFIDENGKLIGGGSADTSDSVKLDAANPNADVNWTSKKKGKFGSFSVNWQYGSTNVVDPAPGDGPKNPADVSRKYELVLISNTERTRAEMTFSERDFERKVGPAVDTPTLKLKLKKPIYRGESPVVGSKKEYIGALTLNCFRGYW